MNPQQSDANLFARQDYLEEAWRVVDLVLTANSPFYEYEPDSRGPEEVRRVSPPGGWFNPILSD